MDKFKVGDKVKIVGDLSYSDNYFVGNTGIIDDIDEEMGIEVLMQDGGILCFSSYKDLELIEEQA